MMIDMIYATSPDLPPLPAGILYQYVTAANGVFVRAERPGLRVLIPVVFCKLPGLADLEPYVRLEGGKVSKAIIGTVVVFAEAELPNEALFYFGVEYGFASADQGVWRATIPQQIATPGSVRPVNPYSDAARDALIELHSHGRMAAFFSATDNQDEQGFRVYAVIGNVAGRAKIRVRVGVYGHFAEIDPGEVFDLPAWMTKEDEPDEFIPEETRDDTDDLF